MIKVTFWLILITLANAQNFIETKVVPPYGWGGGGFGNSIILDDDYLYVGDPRDNQSRGAVYIFRKSNNAWQFRFKLSHPTFLRLARFGGTIVKWNNYLFIGAISDTSNNRPTGVVYMYEIRNDSLIFHQRIIPKGAQENADFGQAIAVNDNYLLVGAPNEEGLNSPEGAVYLYKFQDGYFNLIYKIQEWSIFQHFLFGYSVCFLDDYIFIGAPLANDAGIYSGVVYAYKLINDRAEFLTKILGSNVSTDHVFGAPLSSDSNMLSIGAPGNIYAQNYPGAVYIYEVGNDLFKEKYLISPAMDSTIVFGTSIKLMGDSILIGALGNAVIGAKGSGYLYVKEDSLWKNKYYFTAGDTQSLDFFGRSCDMIDNRFAFGSPYYNSVYIYEFGLVPVDDDLEDTNSYQLYQNYPNPFNSVTSIKFAIPFSEMVHMKVYDVLGKEVATLLNEERPAGSYEVKFDASGLTSGIYFYRVTAGSYVSTRKMILIK